jgi:hypothetical protein
MVSTAKFVSLRSRKKQEKSPGELISALKPYIGRALDKGQGNVMSEISIILRKKSDDILIQETDNEKQRLDWIDDFKPQNSRAKLLEGWEEQKSQEMQRVLRHCEGIIPSMIEALKNDRIVSTEIVLKFRYGKFSWSTERTESQFDKD